MLNVQDICKIYPSPSGARTLFQNLSFELRPSERLALLGRNGQGKSTLIKILGGAIWPSGGRVDWGGMEPSWPIGFSGAFQGGLTGIDNIRFISRIYHRSFEDIADYTEKFAELGEALLMPVKHYSTGMRARLAFGLSLAIEFDCYLIDEVIAVGDSSFQEKCQAELFGRRADRAFIIASHDTDLLRRTCDRAIIIDRGRAKVFDDINLAADIYEAIGMRAASDEALSKRFLVKPVGAELSVG